MSHDETSSEVTDASFEREILKSQRPTIVAFWAPWSVAWRQVEPQLDLLSQEFDGRVRYVRASIEGSAMTASQYGVGMLPALVLIWRGQALQLRDGLLDHVAMRALFEQAASLEEDSSGE
jgi:thioredoxin 1